MTLSLGPVDPLLLASLQSSGYIIPGLEDSDRYTSCDLTLDWIHQTLDLTLERITIRILILFSQDLDRFCLMSCVH